MDVDHAQHKVRELYDALNQRCVDVKFGIHPVAGRMPGHMNVLLAEADIPYDHLLDMDEINGDFPQTDVALIIGANDVTNPAAREDRNSPIFGMPILDVDKARTVMVIKRGMSPGFAGIDNPLYYLDRTLMLFGDAKSFVGSIVREVSGGEGCGELHRVVAPQPMFPGQGSGLGYQPGGDFDGGILPGEIELEIGQGGRGVRRWDEAATLFPRDGGDRLGEGDPHHDQEMPGG